MRALVADGGMDLRLGQVVGAERRGAELEARDRAPRRRLDLEVAATCMLPFFGLTMKLGPIAGWGLNLHENLIPVDTEKFETSVPGIFAIGDINTYPGKLKLILSGFHEGALAAQKVHRYVFPEKKLISSTRPPRRACRRSSASCWRSRSSRRRCNIRHAKGAGRDQPLRGLRRAPQ